MPRLDIDRDAYVRRIDRRMRRAGMVAQAGRAVGLVRAPMQAAVYDATFRSDAEALDYFYAQRNDHLPDLENPVWLNEKIRWQFLHHPNPLMSLAADKIAARDYLRFKGAEVPAPDLIAWGSDPAELAALDLPERYVVKSSYGSGQMHMETGEEPGSGAALAARVTHWMEIDHWRHAGEMHYRAIPKRWLVEEFLTATRSKLEYKITCFHGEPAFIAVITERDGKRLASIKNAMFDPQWNRIDLRIRGLGVDDRPLPRPERLDLLLAEARRLSEDFLHVRVDFLQFDDRLVFSELTFASLAARIPFEPVEANARLGALMDLDRAPEYLARGRWIADAIEGAAPEAPPAPGASSQYARAV